MADFVSAFNPSLNGTMCIDQTGSIYISVSHAQIFITEKYGSILTGIEINQKNALSVSVFPNPSTGEFSIINNALSDEMNFEVYNLTGQKLLESESDAQTTSINLSSFEAGVYLLSVSDKAGKRYFQKLVKE